MKLSNFSDQVSASDIKIEGLPFEATSDEVGGSVMARYLTTVGQHFSANIGSGQDFVRILSSDTGNWAFIQHSDLNNASASIALTFSYRIA